MGPLDVWVGERRAVCPRVAQGREFIHLSRAGGPGWCPVGYYLKARQEMWVAEPIWGAEWPAWTREAAF